MMLAFEYYCVTLFSYGLAAIGCCFSTILVSAPAFAFLTSRIAIRLPLINSMPQMGWLWNLVTFCSMTKAFIRIVYSLVRFRKIVPDGSFNWSIQA